MNPENCDVCGAPEVIRLPYVVFTKQPEGTYQPGDTTSGWLVPIYGPICRTCFEQVVELMNTGLVRNPKHPFWENK